jgi:hypothetical protein
MKLRSMAGSMKAHHLVSGLRRYPLLVHLGLGRAFALVFAVALSCLVSRLQMGTGVAEHIALHTEPQVALVNYAFEYCASVRSLRR